MALVAHPVALQDSTHVRLRFDMLDPPWQNKFKFVIFVAGDEGIFEIGHTPRVIARRMSCVAEWPDNYDVQCALLCALRRLCHMYGRAGAEEIIACGGLLAILEYMADYCMNAPPEGLFTDVGEGSPWLGAQQSALCSLYLVMNCYDDKRLLSTIIAECGGLRLVWMCAERYMEEERARWLQSESMIILHTLADNDKLPPYTKEDYENDVTEPQDLAAIADLAISYIETDPGDGAEPPGRTDLGYWGLFAALNLVVLLAFDRRYAPICWGSLRSPECQDALTRLRRETSHREFVERADCSLRWITGSEKKRPLGRWAEVSDVAAALF
jgi:hypothetical protein